MKTRHSIVCFHCKTPQFLSPLVPLTTPSSFSKNSLTLFICFLLLATAGCKDETVATNKASTSTTPPVKKLPTEPFQIGGETYVLELAFTNYTRQQGLMFRESLAADEGMFFAFRYPEIQSFYMKNCLIDLDIIYLKADGTIDSIHQMTVPIPGEPLEHYRSKEPVQYAIELAAGQAGRLNLQPGQKIPLPARVGRIIIEP